MFTSRCKHCEQPLMEGENCFCSGAKAEAGVVRTPAEAPPSASLQLGLKGGVMGLSVTEPSSK